MKKNDPKNNKSTTIILRVTPKEKTAISTMAMASGNSKSDYIRKVALGYPIIAKSDLESIKKLLKVGADQGRLGGLLKKLITECENIEMSPNEIRPLLHKNRVGGK